MQFPSFKIHTKIQVRVSRCNFQVSRFTPRSRSGFQGAISKFQDSHQDPGQGFKVQFPSFKIHTKIQVRVSRCNFQVSRFTPRSRSGFQGAISKFQDSHQDPGQGFKVQFPSFKIHTKIQVRVSRCNFQVSRFTPRSRSGFQDAISKFQDSHQDPGQGFKMQFPSFKIQTKIQVRVSSCNFQVSRFTTRSRSGFQVAISRGRVWGARSNFVLRFSIGGKAWLHHWQFILQPEEGADVWPPSVPLWNAKKRRRQFLTKYRNGLNWQPDITKFNQVCWLEPSSVHAPAPMAVHTRMSYKVKVRCMTLPEMVWEFCDTYSLLDIYSFFCSRDLLTSRKDRKRGAPGRTTQSATQAWEKL